MKQFTSIFKNKTFTKLFLATFTSQMGNTIGMTAFMFYLLDRFGDQPVYATVTELMYSLPTLAVFFLVGVMADLMDRQKIAYYCDWISALLSIALLGAILLDWMPLVFALLFLRSAVSKFFFPAETAIVQGILSKDEYTSSAGLNQMMMSLFMLFGSALGASVYWVFGVTGAVLIDALTFIISALLIKACRIEEHVRLANGPHALRDIKVVRIMSEFKDGLTYILHHKLLIALITGFVVFGVVNGGFSVMPIFILKYKLAPEMYEQMAVITGFVFGAAVLIGSIFGSLLAKKWKLYQMMIVGLAGSGSLIVAAAYVQHIWLYFVLMACVGLVLPLVNIAIGGWLPAIVDPKMMGRVQGWITPLMMLSQSVTLGAIAFSFPRFIEVGGLFIVVGCCLLLVSIMYAVTLPKLADAQEVVPLKEQLEV
ncbi:MFS transporter [Bacillus sp. HMF5848]|uniref:MFS transporter n=1 Tax=Bacillus sp. HMF5848 TaxID=2495421 RepID=UPI000F775339|nr:MFS transporter [Bacillus sp. HMF5848]RSK26285.1 MFS transporter [Bacillus sp. HMF5848]